MENNLRNELAELLLFLDDKHKMYVEHYKECLLNHRDGMGIGFWSLAESHKLSANGIMDTMNELCQIIDKYGLMESFSLAKWTPVVSQNPPLGVQVIGYFTGGDEGGTKVATAIMHEEGNLISDFPNSTVYHFKATHWMFIPDIS